MSLKEATNQHYDEHADDFRLARDFYSTDDTGRYLTQGKYEADGAYQARRRSAHAFPYSRQIIHRISDQILLRADEVERELGPIRGSYVEAAGPEEESHNLQMKTLSDYLLLFGEAWLQVRPTGSGAELRVLSPLTVPRWKDQQVLTLGQAAKPDVPLSEDEQVDTTYTVHTPRGFTTYMFRKNDSGDEERVQIESGTYAPAGTEDAFFVGAGGNPTPPLIRVQMPWETVLGVEIAQTHLQMYRLENQLDGRLHTALTSGQLVYNGLDEDGEQKVIHSHKKGKNLIFLPEDADVAPMEVPTEAVGMAEERLANKEETLYETAYNTLKANTSDSSATETVVKQQSTAAALATLASTVESAEESVLRLVAQAQNIVDFGGPTPQDPGVSNDWTSIDWTQSSVDLTPSTE
ncbi:hypothetical protein GGQ10_002121 [Salinibacter ruber]|uniref:DUF4055 domain-containing protein n=1 Tax=Salinibacter ruber TaxID=146919 RepID=UPI002168B7D1|nr:DUF4055 domain-containing protein [Salinibacter ruber]MCS4087295.1 hypothetical protein [Salinibacter ruber]